VCVGGGEVGGGRGSWGWKAVGGVGGGGGCKACSLAARRWTTCECASGLACRQGGHVTVTRGYYKKGKRSGRRGLLTSMLLIVHHSGGRPECRNVTSAGDETMSRVHASTR
jgi:hypothetical protein